MTVEGQGRTDRSFLLRRGEDNLDIKLQMVYKQRLYTRIYCIREWCLVQYLSNQDSVPENSIHKKWNCFINLQSRSTFMLFISEEICFKSFKTHHVVNVFIK